MLGECSNNLQEPVSGFEIPSLSGYAYSVLFRANFFFTLSFNSVKLQENVQSFQLNHERVNIIRVVLKCWSRDYCGTQLIMARTNKYMMDS